MSARCVETENHGVGAIVGVQVLAVWAFGIDVPYGEWRMIIGFVGGGVEADFMSHEVGFVANNGFGGFPGERLRCINEGEVVFNGREYATGHTFILFIAQTGLHLCGNGPRYG